MTDFLPNEDQRPILRMIQEYFAAEQPVERLRWTRDGFSIAAFNVAEVAALGLFGMGLAEPVGLGLGVVEEVLLMRECGRHLVSPTLMANILAAHVAQRRRPEVIPGLMAGSSVVGLALAADGEAGEAREVLVCGYEGADLIVVLERDRVGLIDAVEIGDVRPQRSLDETAPLHAASLPATAGVWCSQEETGLNARATLLMSAQMVGLAEGATKLSVEYAKVRQQFGQPIGAFQAVKHRCADMAVRSELAWAQTLLAAASLRDAAPDAILQVAAAQMVSAAAAHGNGASAIQVHGGIGYQAECDAHHFMKRAHLYDQACGGRGRQAGLILSQPRPF
ncbi:hypothetical protein BH10PSE1_BH10PSE1_08580 [soil metagenome]